MTLLVRCSRYDTHIDNVIYVLHAFLPHGLGLVSFPFLLVMVTSNAFLVNHFFMLPRAGARYVYYHTT
jgi:hypothetical protein